MEGERGWKGKEGGERGETHIFDLRFWAWPSLKVCPLPPPLPVHPDLPATIEASMHVQMTPTTGSFLTLACFSALLNVRFVSRSLENKTVIRTKNTISLTWYFAGNLKHSSFLLLVLQEHIPTAIKSESWWEKEGISQTTYHLHWRTLVGAYYRASSNFTFF